MRSLHRINLTVMVVTLVTLAWAGYLAANSGGRVGVCESANGCNCHGPDPNGNGDVTVSITGPQDVQVGSTNSYMISVSGGPAGTTGGFNLCTSEGTLIPGTGNEESQGELTHSNGNNRSWTFEWTAPGTETVASFTAVAMSTNDGGTSGDSWNWYGDAVGTGFDIAVTATVPTDPITWGKLKKQYQ